MADNPDSDTPSSAGSRPLLTPRRLLFLLIMGAGVLAAVLLDLSPARLVPPSKGGFELAGRFFSAALSPALDYQEAGPAPAAEPLPIKALKAAWTTIAFAAAAVSISLVIGFLLGVVSSSTWQTRMGENRFHPMLGAAVRGIIRSAIALIRSVHELIWAVLLMAAFGVIPAVAVIAIAIPYSGTFAKIFAEMIDEAPTGVARVLQSTGASRPQSFLMGLLPGILPELVSYTLYRFECGLRSAAVMGFLGVPTLGYFIKLSFDNLHFREVWSYLYVLGAIVVIFDIWSGALRKRIVHPTQHPS